MCVVFNSLSAEKPFLTFLNTVVATEGGVLSDIPPTLWCFEDSCRNAEPDVKMST